MFLLWCRERRHINNMVLLARRSVVDHMRGMAQRISGSRVTVRSRFDTTKTEVEGRPPLREKYLAESR